MRVALIHFRLRAERWLALFPALRCFACAFFIAGGSAAAVSGLLLLDNWPTAALDFVLAIFFLGIGAALWSME